MLIKRIFKLRTSKLPYYLEFIQESKTVHCLSLPSQNNNLVETTQSSSGGSKENLWKPQSLFEPQRPLVNEQHVDEPLQVAARKKHCRPRKVSVRIRPSQCYSDGFTYYKINRNTFWENKSKDVLMQFLNMTLS